MLYKSKKILASVLTAMLVMSGAGATGVLPATEVYAAYTQDNNELTINNDPSSSGVTIVGVDFTAYQVFKTIIEETATDSDEMETISYEIGAGFYDFFDDTDYVGDLKLVASENLSNGAKASEYVSRLSGNDLADFVDDLRDYIDDKNDKSVFTTTKVAGVKTTAPDSDLEYVEFSGLADGYYLVNDSLGSMVSHQGTVVAPSVLIPVPAVNSNNNVINGAIDVNIKASAPGIDKDIWHNDENSGAGDWDDVADHQIGDTVQFQVKSDIPQNIHGYGEGYTYIIRDTMSTGLDFDNTSITISLYDGTKVISGTETTINGSAVVSGNLATYIDSVSFSPTGGEDFEIIFKLTESLTDDNGAMLGVPDILRDYSDAEQFLITYSATLTEEALISSNGDGAYDDNKVELEYGNNPYETSPTPSTGKDDDTVYSTSFKSDFVKLDKTDKPLSGAVFALYIGGDQVYLNESGKGTGIYYPVKTVAEANNTVLSDTVTNFGTDSGTVTGMILTDASLGGKFTINGLDDNIEYTLEEVYAPAGGYTVAADTTFTITATHDDPTDSATIVIKSAVNGSTAAEGDVSATIYNSKNVLLPETGGVGTVMFYVIGGVLTALAGLLVALRLRKPTK